MKAREILFSLAVLSSLAFGSDTVYDVQSQLSDRGYGVGVDGKLGRGTSKAIRQYQEDNGLRVNGRVTNELLDSLGIGSGTQQTQQVSNTSNYSSNNSSSSSSDGSFLDGISMPSGNLTNNLKSGKYKIGFLAAWPTYGLSLKVDYSDKINLEVVAAPMGTFSAYSAKVNYYLTKERNYSTYAYASGGVAMYDYNIPKSSGYGYSYEYESDTETVPMFGAGIGLEWSWRKFLGNDFPDLYSTIEFGYANMSFDYYDFGGLLYGGGIYYKF